MKFFIKIFTQTIIAILAVLAVMYIVRIGYKVLTNKHAERAENACMDISKDTYTHAAKQYAPRTYNFSKQMTGKNHTQTHMKHSTFQSQPSITHHH